MSFKIDIDSENHHFIISGKISEILKNRRVLNTLKRLKCINNVNSISVPYEPKSQIEILTTLKSLLELNRSDYSLDIKIKNDLESYQREVDNFKVFSNSAELIRNDRFQKNPKLVSYFMDFKKILERDLVRTLYPLQMLSAFHMAFAQNACNFAVPGAGKTSIVYGAYAYLKSLPIENSKHVDNILVIGPLSSFAAWESEYYECFGRKAESFRMSGNSSAVSRYKKEAQLYSHRPKEITLIFHGGVPLFENEIIDFLKNHKTMVVVDEAHRIKNHEGVWGKSVTEISKEAVSRIVLTGTPVPNGYQDLYNLFKFIYPYKYKDIIKFHYHNLEEMTTHCDSESSLVNDLKNNISPYFIRIKKRDLKLPEPFEKNIVVEMDYRQRQIYEFIENEYIAKFKEYGCANDVKIAKDALNRAKLIRLRQAATNPSLLIKSIKESIDIELDGVSSYQNTYLLDNEEFYINDSDILNEILNYSNNEVPLKFIETINLVRRTIEKKEKVIIWTIFIQNAKELMNLIMGGGFNAKLLIGEIPQEEREETIKKFNNPNNLDFNVVIANPFSVAESISLHKGCHTAIYLERDYNCSNFLQSKDRIHRVGLDSNAVTQYYYLISKDSIDEVIDEKLKVKIERMEKIIDDDIPLFSRLNDDDETDIISGLITNYAKRNK